MYIVAKENVSQTTEVRHESQVHSMFKMLLRHLLLLNANKLICYLLTLKQGDMVIPSERLDSTKLSA